MALSKVDICDFGWRARDFSLKGVDGKTYTLADVRGPKGTLVVFICNHCPYVKASIGRIVAEAKALREIGIGTIAIMPNDTEAYREIFDNIKAFSASRVLPFPTFSMRRRRWHDLWRTMHARLLRLQRPGRATVSRTARCFAHTQMANARRDLFEAMKQVAKPVMAPRSKRPRWDVRSSGRTRGCPRKCSRH